MCQTDETFKLLQINLVWGSLRYKLHHIVKAARKMITRIKLSDLSNIFKGRAISKARAIYNWSFHPPCGEFELLTSGRRFRAHTVKSSRHKNYFISHVIILLISQDDNSAVVMVIFFCSVFYVLDIIVHSMLKCTSPWADLILAE